MPIGTKPILGQVLIEKCLITPAQLETALHKQKESGGLLGAILMELNFLDDEASFLPILAHQIGVTYVNLKEIEIVKDAIRQIPARLASYYKIMPIRFEGGTLTMASTRPLDIHLQDEIGLVLKAKLNPVLAGQKDILEAIRKYYGLGAETIEAMMQNVDLKMQTEEKIADINQLDAEASMSKFLNQILLEAYTDRATDIHIEPFINELRIRYRIDGVLYDAKVPANIKYFKETINSRIKILSNLNITEKRIPQDGRFKVRVGEVELDLRVSFLPTPCGESVVLRILNATRLYTFSELGLSENERKFLDQLIRKPHGIIFLTGPTGSGKTTTLYSCLSRINTGDKKIVTIEDPIEYQLKGLTQIQVNPEIGLTFARGLRSMLRHDPDIMMVGEVRDTETADIAVQVALTGHLVFSTLHTNDAVGGVARLLDMGVEPYLITSTVECFIAQRLVRILCPQCKHPAEVTAAMVHEFNGISREERDMVFYEGKGCEACHLTGYVGREAIYEFMPMNEGIRQLIMQRATASQVKQKAVEAGMRTLQQSGWEKVKKGLTTPQEVLRVTQEE